MGWFFSSGDQAREVERLHDQTERAFQRGNAAKGFRLAGKHERAHAELERATGRPWSPWGRPRQD